MKTASSIAVVLLVSCARVSAPEASPLMRTVPSRAVEVMHFPHLEQALELLFDSTSVFRSIDYGRMDDAEMVLSYDYSAGLIPLLAIDAGRSAADTSSAARKVLEQAAGLNLYALHTGDLLPKRAAILLSPSQASVDEAFRHIESRVSILDANGFADALSLAGEGAGMLILKNENTNRWLPKGLLEDVYPRKAVSSFVSQAAQWTVMDYDGGRAEDIRLRFLPDAMGKSLSAIFEGLPAAPCKLASALPDSASFVLDMAFKDCRQYTAAWERCLDARAALSKYNGRVASLRKQFGRKPADWLAGLDPVELARVRWDGHDVLLLRPSRKPKNAGLSDNAYPGFVPALFGEAFRLPCDSATLCSGGWVAFGSAGDVQAWADAAKVRSSRLLPGKIKYLLKTDELYLFGDDKKTVLNVTRD